MAIPLWLRRWLRRWHHPFRRVPLELLYSDGYALGRSLTTTVHQDPLRGERILSSLLHEGWSRPDRLLQPRRASLRALRRVHGDRYLETLREPEGLKRALGTLPTAQQADTLLEVQRHMCGGTLYGAHRALADGGIVANLGGGLHHAHAGKGQGFCLFNDVAVAIASLRGHGFPGRVLVVDLDLHHGDGTEALFQEDESVHTFSIHNQDWDQPKAVESTRIELGAEVEDERYLTTLREALPPVVERFQPEFAFYLAGVDPAWDDRLGDWNITPRGLLQRDLFVLQQLRSDGRSIPTVIVLAGGYGAEAWRYSARFLTTLLNGGRPAEPMSTDEITLLRYRGIARRMDPRKLTGSDPTDEWQLTEEDLVGLAGSPGPTRFLDYYSRHGLELVLEEYGLLDHLRARGFRGFHLDWELSDPSGQTLRLFAGPHREHLLVELRARRDRRTVPGMELLRVEWLLLQDPTATFPQERPPLPGQDHPGLGLLREVVALLVVVCDRLKLDGLSFVPAHYHLAVASRKLLRFLKAEDRALFQALKALLAQFTVAEASRLVDDGRIRWQSSGEILRWPRPPMVLPVSERMKHYLGAREEANGSLSLPTFEVI